MKRSSEKILMGMESEPVQQKGQTSQRVQEPPFLMRFMQWQIIGALALIVLLIYFSHALWG